MSKFPDREDIDMFSSDKNNETKKPTHSNLYVAFEASLSSQGEMDINYKNNTYTRYFFEVNSAV